MKVTYTLTWEEFKELYGDFWPHPDYFSTIVVAMISVPLIGYGISLLIFGNLADEKLLPFTFIGAPLFLLVSAAASLKSQSKKVMDRVVAEKRAEYNRWHAKEQSFSFDQNKWIHETEAGKQEVPWQALLKSEELPSVWRLVAESGSVLLPKRVLEPGSIDALRQCAFLVAANRWPFRISCWDFHATETARLWRKYWFRLAFANIFGLAMLGWVLCIWLTSDAKKSEIWGWILASFAIILALTAQLWYLPLRYLTSPQRWRTPKSVAISTHGFHLTDSRGDMFTAWRVFRSFQEVRGAFLLHTDPAHYYLLAKHYFSANQQNEFRQLLQKNVKPVHETNS